MRSHLPWLRTGLIGLALSATSAVLIPGIAAAQDAPATTTTTTTTTIVVSEDVTADARVEPTLPELAPGESPGITEAETGPVLTFVVPEPAPATTDVVPAGPVVFDPVGTNALGDNTKTVMFLLVLAAVPSLTVGTALWVHRDRALSRYR